MAGQGFGLSILVTWSHSERTYDGKKVLCMDIVEDLTGRIGGGLVQARATDKTCAVVRRLLP
ncbi:Cys regulon transcriptional activator CysB [Pseudomonas chlororaphis subsp. piscium]|nr:Cys regulon transcriptional activator CysB [Pseudomonas chlororaphis subsp. piscium]